MATKAAKGADKGGDDKKKPDPALLAFQIEVETEIQWRSLLRREGLIVIDVYTSWAGPCVSMVNILKRIKVEVNDDRLWYGLACSDIIDDLLMFKDQSEPCWLFIGGGKPIRVFKGSHVPNLTAAIKTEFEHEMQCIEGKARRNFITIDDEVSKRRKAEAEAARLREMVTEVDAAESLNEIRRDSSITLMGHLAPYSCVIIQPFVVEMGAADEIRDYLSGDFKIVQEIIITMTEDLARQIYRIPYEIPLPVVEEEVQEFTMTAPAGDDDADNDEPTPAVTAAKTPSKKKKKKSTQPVPLPEGLLGETVALLLENEEITAYHEKGQLPPSDLLQTADDILRVKVGPIKYEDAVKHAPACLHATYGKQDAPGVWCPRIYDDKRFVILNIFQTFVSHQVELKAPEPKKYTLLIYPVSSTIAITDNEDVQNNIRDVVAMEKMKIPEELIEPFLKSGPISDGDFMMKKAAMAGQDVLVVSISSKNAVLKDSLYALAPIYMSSTDQNGRVQTSKLFPQLKISEEEKADPDEILAKFLGRSKPRIKAAQPEEEPEQKASHTHHTTDDDDNEEEMTDAPPSTKTAESSGPEGEMTDAPPSPQPVESSGPEGEPSEGPESTGEEEEEDEEEAET